MYLTIYKYVAKKFLSYLLIVFLISAGLMLLFDSIELVRVTHNLAIGFSQIIKLAMMKNYSHIQKIWIFIILIASILTYQKLVKNFELIAARAIGLSVLQLLSPVLLSVFIIGILHVTILNPIGSYLLGRYQHLEAINLKEQKSLINVSKSGLWLKQYDQDDQLLIIHALRVSQLNNTIYDVSIFFLTGNGSFVKRIDAEKAELINNHWLIHQVTMIDADYKIEKMNNMKLPTQVTFSQIVESLIAPDMISFWRLPGFITMTQQSGFSALPYQLYFFQMILSPLFFMSIVVISYSFAISLPRHGKSGLFFAAGICAGFIIYFMADFISAIALSGNIPVTFAAFIPIVITIIIGLYLILYFEFSV